MSDGDQGDSPTRILRLFEEGRRFTEDLLRENERLRLVAARLKAEKLELENRYIKVDVPRLQERVRLVEDEVRTLRDENRELHDQFQQVEDENREFADRYLQVERQYSDLIQLYVATHRLHATLDHREVLQTIKEIVINMVGSECFGLYLVSREQGRLILAAGEGIADRPRSLSASDELLGSVLASGAVWVRPGPDGRSSDPVAIVPLKVDEHLVGLIIIHALLEQKAGIESNDLEMFELLGAHAATAICGASLFRIEQGQPGALDRFIDLLIAEGE